LFSVTMPCKGVGHQYCSAILVKLVRSLGLQNGILKSDAERSLVALRRAVQEKLLDMGSEDAVKGESATNGPIEAAVGRLQGQARTLRSSLLEHYGSILHPKHPVLCWMVDYCGTLLSRFLRGEDGRTAYERSTGKQWRILLPEFAECVLYQPLKGERDRKKMEPRFEMGVFLGIQESTAMRWIGTADGVVRTWTIKRLPEEDKWQSDLLEKMVGLPWQLRPTSSKPLESDAPPLTIELAPEEKEVEPEPKVEQKRKGYVPRGIYVRRDVELKRFGFTPGCDGCERARMGLSYRAHSSVCKARIMEELNKSDEGKKKVDRVKRKEEEFLVAYQEREERQKASGQQGEKPGKRQKQEEALREMDEILGPLNEQVGQGGPVSAAASSSAPVEIVEESGAVGGEAENMEVERMARDEPQHSMDIGALHRLNDDVEFVEKVREASVAETSQLMAMMKQQSKLIRGMSRFC
jgi:hypothetical protein